MPISFHIEKYRKQKGISVHGLSAMSGVSSQQIENMEAGTAKPQLYEICKLSQALKVNAHLLYNSLQ